MKIKRLSSITRPVDLAYPTNLAITVIALLFLFGTTGFQLVSEKDIFPALYTGLRGGASVFLAWAFAREIDPDKEYAAFVAVFFGCIGFVFFPSPSLLALLLALLLIRVVNRSTGLPARASDSFVIFLFSGWFLMHGDLVFYFVTVLAFVLDSFLPEPNRRHLAFAGAALGALFIFLSFSDRFLSFLKDAGENLSTQGTDLTIFILTAAFFFIPLTFNFRTILSKGDLTGIPLNPLRVRAARLLALLTVSFSSFLWGWEGVESLTPLWAAIFGVSIYGYSELLLKKLSMLPVMQG